MATSHHHGSTVKRKHSQFDAYVSVRLRSTDLATIAKWLVSQGQFFWSKSKLIQTAVDLAVQRVISLGGEHISSTEEALDLLKHCEVGGFHPASKSQFALMRKLQEEGAQESDHTPQDEEREETRERKSFEDLGPEQQQAAIDAGFDPLLGRTKSIEERDAEYRKALDTDEKRLREQGTIVDTGNDEAG